MKRIEIYFFSIIVIISIDALCANILLNPESKEIEVNEGDFFYIEFYETDTTTDITRCYYKAGSIEGSFDVIKTSEDTRKRKKFKYDPNVQNWGNAGRCRIDVNDVNEATPTSWEFTAYDDESKTNVTANISVKFFHSISLLKPQTLVTEHTSYVQHLLNPQKLIFKTCQIKSEKNTTITLSINSTSAQLLSDPNEETSSLLPRILSLGDGYCGFHLKDISPSDPTQWEFTATDTDGNSYRNTAKITLLPTTSKRVVKEVRLGDTATLECGLQKPKDQYYCYLYHPNGNLVYKGQYCSGYSVGIVGLKDVGEWRCVVGSEEGGMEGVEFVVELKQIDEENIVTWSEDKGDYISLGCQLKNPTTSASADYCEIISPQKTSYFIYPGAATDKYTSVATNLTTLTCSIEIPKPLNTEQHGMWKCQMKIITSLIGGFIALGNVRKDLIYAKNYSQTIQLGQPFTITCNVPYSSDYCHIKSPNGTIYPSNDRYEATLGECSIDITLSVTSDNGTWICSFARDNGQNDENIYVHITIAEVLVYYTQIEVTQGENLQLMCNSGGVPLQYCRFETPKGDAYQLKMGQKSDVVSYYGSGLEFGECGIKISNVNYSEEGNWTCTTRLGYQFTGGEINAKTFVKILNQPMGAAEVASIGVAVAMSIILISYFGVYCYRRRVKKKSLTPSESMELTHPAATASQNNPESPPCSVRRVRRSRTLTGSENMDLSHPTGTASKNKLDCCPC